MMLLCFALFSQETEPGFDSQLLTEETPPVKTFPLALILENADYARAGTWQPDWPPDFPPDAFRLAAPDWISITVNTGQGQYTLNRDRLHFQYPCVFEDALIQVRLDYLTDDEGNTLLKYAELENIAEIEVIEYLNNDPYLLRLYREDYFFIYLQYGTGIIIESWFDREGIFLEQYEYHKLYGEEGISSITKYSDNEEITRSFDSRFLVTRILGDGLQLTATYYRDYLPRYWSREFLIGNGIQRLIFQWDENELLVGSNNYSFFGEFTDSRYEYTFDERGNWIERRELRMAESIGIMVPVPGATITRIIDYSEFQVIENRE